MNEQETSEQKFHTGDLVRVAKDLGPTMPHFESDMDAIVIDKATHRHIYHLQLKGDVRVAWYEEHQLTLIARGHHERLEGTP